MNSDERLTRSLLNLSRIDRGIGELSECCAGALYANWRSSASKTSERNFNQRISFGLHTHPKCRSTFVFVIKKISFFLYYGYELVQLVSNIRMNWDVKDGSGRKWQFCVVSPFVLSFCHCFCSQECSWKNSLLKARERTHKRSASHIHCTEWLQICLAFYLSLLSLLTWHLRRSRSRQLARDPETCRHSVLEVQYS